jgi:hypothetical protein
METSRDRKAARATARLRWLGLGAAVAFGLWACNARRLVKPTPELSLAQKHQFQQALNRKLDLLFMIDDSASMQPLQSRLAKNLPVLVQRLTALPGGLPDIHIAVVSSSSQAGDLTSVEACAPGNVPNGSFRHAFNPTGIANHPECAGLTLDGTFIKAEAGAPPNFTGRIEDVFSCIALLGQNGCGFEQQFGSIVRALDPQQALPENAGFLRADAYLGVVMLTNEDDCSTEAGTSLFDEVSATSAGPRGRLVSYRCTEFGILCGGQRPPHTLPAHTTQQETSCVPADDQGDLIKTIDFETFLLGLKHGNRSKLLVAAISGPPAPFAVSTYESCSSIASPTDPTAPGLVPSCGSDCSGAYADPGVRVARVVNDLGGVLFNVCDDDYGPAMTQIATALGMLLEPECLPATIENNAAGEPDCTVTNRAFAADGRPVDTALPYCGTDAAPFPSPCWHLLDSPAVCGADRLLRVCRDPTCAPPSTMGATESDLLVECAVPP